VHQQFKALLQLSDGHKLAAHFKRLGFGPVNFIFAAANGDIGYAPGVVFPDRKYKVTHGSFPKQGWKQENSWLGFVDADELPHLVNPASGFIGSCNNRISSERV